MTLTSRRIATKALVLLSSLSVAFSWIPSQHSQLTSSSLGRKHRSHRLYTLEIGQDEAWRSETSEETDYVICGGGPAGLLSAIMLAQKFPNVRRCFDF